MRHTSPACEHAHHLYGRTPARRSCTSPAAFPSSVASQVGRRQLRADRIATLRCLHLLARAAALSAQNGPRSSPHSRRRRSAMRLSASPSTTASPCPPFAVPPSSRLLRRRAADDLRYPARRLSSKPRRWEPRGSRTPPPPSPAPLGFVRRRPREATRGGSRGWGWRRGGLGFHSSVARRRTTRGAECGESCTRRTYHKNF
jgi:hypothetical protein